MTYSSDIRWRVVVLRNVYGLDIVDISELLGPKETTIRKWLTLFNKSGLVETDHKNSNRRNSRWPQPVLEYVKVYAKVHPCFLLEELQRELATLFPLQSNISVPTICRALRHNLGLSRKVC